MNLDKHASVIASNLLAASGGTCTALCGEAFTARELFDAIKAKLSNVAAVVSDTGRTLHLVVLAEDTRRWGHNQRLNMVSAMNHIRRVQLANPERVWS
jgi:hypothetical protein